MLILSWSASDIKTISLILYTYISVLYLTQYLLLLCLPSKVPLSEKSKMKWESRALGQVCTKYTLSSFGKCQKGQRHFTESCIFLFIF